MKIRKADLKKIIKEVILSEIIASTALGVTITAGGGGMFSTRGTSDSSASSASGANNKVLIIGDSQIGGALGDALVAKYSGRIAGRIYRNGSSDAQWTSSIWDQEAKPVVSGSCPGYIIISLGGNSVGSPIGLINKIRETCNSGIVWTGAPPADNDQAGRQQRNVRISDSISSADNTQFINPFEFIKKSDGTPGWDGGDTDVHLTPAAARAYVAAAPFF